MKKKKIHFLTIITGLIALIWFLIRVIPKPSRATYPCQQAAFPVASAFVIWLAGLIGSLAIITKAKTLFKNKFISKGIIYLIVGMGIFIVGKSLYYPHLSLASPSESNSFTPTDSPNTPVGEGKGIHPGRVAWVHDSSATNWDGYSDNWWDDTNTNQEIVNEMVENSIYWLTGIWDVSEAWDSIFKHFNYTRGKGNIGYTAGEKIAIKVNMNTCSNLYAQHNASKPTPQLVLAFTTHLVDSVGVAQEDISFYDVTYNKYIAIEFYNKITSRYSNIRFVDYSGHYDTVEIDSSCQIKWSENLTLELQGGNPTYLPKTISEAEYIINIANLKGHDLAGITMNAKNHFGTIQAYSEAYNYKGPKAAGVHPYITVHDYGNCQGSGSWDMCGREMGTYNALVDIMGHEHLGNKTLLFIIDALYCATSQNTSPSKWQSSPFNDDWTSSLFISQDGVAIESVGLDFLRCEPTQAYVYGNVDNYLHEAAQANNPPSGHVYDPEDDGISLKSLGVHEHWNNATDKKYSRNLGANKGIELISSLIQAAKVFPSSLPGVYDTTVQLSFHTGYKDLTIYYTVDGTEPLNTSNLYNGEVFSLDTNIIFKLKTNIPDISDTTNYTFVYEINKEPQLLEKVDSIRANFPSGRYGNYITIYLSCKDTNTVIFYTLDGSEPDMNANLYQNSPISLTRTTEIKAKAYKSGYQSSDVFTFAYTIEKIEEIYTDYAPGTYDSTITVSLSASEENANIYYTVDGSTPNEGSILYEGSITITSPTDIKAIAYKPDYIPSDVFNFNYYIRLTSVIPILSEKNTLLFPNPANNMVTIIPERNQVLELNIYTQTGKKARSLTINDRQTVYMGDCSPGLYIFEFKTSKGSFTKKIIIK